MNENRVKKTAFRLAFNVPHMDVPDFMELEAMALDPIIVDGSEPPPVNKESAEYLAGASDAFKYFVKFLKQKGPGK